MHDHIISRRVKVWAQETSVTPPVFIEVSAPIPESARPYICVVEYQFCLFLRFFYCIFEMF